MQEIIVGQFRVTIENNGNQLKVLNLSNQKVVKEIPLAAFADHFTGVIGQTIVKYVCVHPLGPHHYQVNILNGNIQQIAGI